MAESRSVDAAGEALDATAYEQGQHTERADKDSHEQEQRARAPALEGAGQQVGDQIPQRGSPIPATSWRPVDLEVDQD